jgi:dipeptidyl aminopeptidase/acylaminoacyl peptidase
MRVRTLPLPAIALAAAALALFGAACGEAPPPVVVPPPTTATPVASSSAPPIAAKATPPATSEPTPLTDAQRARDQALAPKAAAVVDAYPNVAGIFSSLVADVGKDKKRFVFASLRDGVPEIYLGDASKPADPPRALTTGPERAIWAALTHDEKYVLFTRDEGADENWRIYRVGLDGSGLTNLTPGPKLHRDEPVLPRGKPDAILYTTHVTTSPASQLVVQAISGGDPKTVYEDPAPAYVQDATTDGKRALVVRWNSASDLVALEVETSGGKPAARVYPPDGTKATIGQAAYSSDGKLVYVATDEGKEGFALLALDAKTHTVKGRYAVDDPPAAGIAAFSVSPAGDRVAVAVNAGNHTEIRILDARKLTLERKLATPLGLAGIGPFTADGKSFPYWLSTPDKPADPILADAATGTSRPLRDEKRPALDTLPPLAVSIEKTQAFDGLTIPINVYLPKAASGQKLPTLVVFHGGPSSSYAVRWSPFTRFFTAQGFAVVEPNIRGSTGFGRAYEMADNREKRADALKDMATVNAWVKSQAWCDPGRVVVFGGSYGGYLTLMAVTRQPTLWRAGVDLFGIADLKTFLKSTDQAIRVGFVDEFGDLEKDGALLDEYSPSRDYDKIAVPLFVYAGQNDPRVPRSESDQIVVALRQRGIPVEYMVAPDEGHSIDRRDNKIALVTRVTRFLDEQLK